MKKLILLFLLVVLSNSVYAQTNVSNIKTKEPEKFLIQYKTSEGKQKGKEKIRRDKGKINKEYEKLNILSVELVDDIIPTLSLDTNIVSIEPDYEIKASSEIVPWGVERINSQYAIEKNISGKGINVAVFDSGISQHADLSIAGGANFADESSNWNDYYGHGTHVAGVISSLQNNYGIIGVAPKSNLYAVKVLDDNGNGLIDIKSGLQQYSNDSGKSIN